MVVDFHVHCFPDELAATAVPRLAAVAGISPQLDGTVSGVRRSMKDSGVDCSVVLNIATKPQQTEKINDWAAEICGEGIVAFGSVHPDFPHWRNELDRIHELGLKGIKYHPDYQEFFADEDRMFPVYEYALSLGLILLFHAGVDIGLEPPYHCTPERLKRVVEAFPGAPIVAAHMGGFRYWDEVEELLAGKDFYLDTSYSLGHMDDFHTRTLIEKHGFQRILFATDSPWGDQSAELEKLRGLKLGEEAETAILGGNAARLLGL